MGWEILAFAIQAGFTIWQMSAQNKEKEKTKQESIGFAERQFAKSGEEFESQQNIERRKLGLDRQRIGIAKEDLKETKRLNRGKQLLALLGADSQLSQNVNDLWSKMGILNTGGA